MFSLFKTEAVALMVEWLARLAHCHEVLSLKPAASEVS